MRTYVILNQTKLNGKQKINNNMTIEINDKVICINSKVLQGNDVAPPLTESSTYEVIGIYTCACGKQHLNVDLPLNYNWVKCYDCKEELPMTNHWCHPSRFTK